MYFINPIIPPSIGLKVSPMLPDFVYIKIINNMLSNTNATTAIFISILFFFFLPRLATSISPFIQNKGQTFQDV